MPQQDSKVTKFIAAINNDADMRMQEIQKEIEEFNKIELKKATDEAIDEARAKYQRDKARLKSKVSVEYSEKEMEKRRALIKKRNEITLSVFDDALKQLSKYTLTDDYTKWMTDNIAKSCSILNSDDLKLIVNKRDYDKIKNELLKATGNKAKIEIGDITIGGYQLISLSKGKIIDDTLDERLKAQYDWFLENSGLSIE